MKSIFLFIVFIVGIILYKLATRKGSNKPNYLPGTKTCPVCQGHGYFVCGQTGIIGPSN